MKHGWFDARRLSVENCCHTKYCDDETQYYESSTWRSLTPSLGSTYATLGLLLPDLLCGTFPSALLTRQHRPVNNHIRCNPDLRCHNNMLMPYVLGDKQDAPVRTSAKAAYIPSSSYSMSKCSALLTGPIRCISHIRGAWVYTTITCRQPF